MTTNSNTLPNYLARFAPDRLPIYYGWVNLGIAVLAMLATLPGRSFGLGLITEPLLQDLNLQRVTFGEMNFWATLAGAAFNLACGPALDRFGIRVIGTLVLMCLGAVVIMFSNVQTAGFLIFLLILMRGLGQSALSVVSLTIVGKWFVRRLSIAMGLFAILIAIGFAIAIVIAQQGVAENGWRTTWATVGWLVVLTGGLSLLFARSGPEAIGLAVDPDKRKQAKSDLQTEAESSIAFTLQQAAGTSAFWILAVGSALYNLVVAGVMLFNQSILSQLGFGDAVFRNAMAILLVTGLAGNFLGGWWARKWPLTRLMSIAMISVAAYLLLFPALQTAVMVLAHAALMGFAGGIVTVIFFTAWGQIFGRPHLGKIQGAAQVLAVLASAAGPWIFATVFERTGSYNPAFYSLAPIVAIVAATGWFITVPNLKGETD